MQATVTTTTRQFGFNRVGTTLVAVGMAAAIAVGAAGSTISDHLPSIGTSEQAIVLPKAHTSVNQGEGMLAGTSAVTAAVRATTSDRQGDGLVGGNLVISDPLVAHPSLGGGEGIVGGHGAAADLTPAITSYDVVGMGEGWVAAGHPDNTLTAYPSEYQGDGLLNTNR